MRVRRRLIATCVCVLAITGCASTVIDPPAPPALWPSGAAVDYQLGGAYEAANGVGVVVRDRAAEPAAEHYSVCYVNGFQTQPGELDLWPDELLLRDLRGEVVFDPAWPDEAIIDTRPVDEVAAVVGPWIRECAADGFDAVEFDNLDTYTRTDGPLTRADAVALAARFAEIAHDADLTAGQKNAAEDAPLLRERAGFDFAVAEECAAYGECGAYTEVYGAHVLAIEYTDNAPQSWDAVCADPETPASVVLRDRNLVTPADEGYVFEVCAD